MSYEKVIGLLKETAARLQKTQSDVARGSHLSVSQVSRIFNFESVPSSESLIAMGKYLHIPPEEVVRLSGLIPPRPDTDELIERATYLFGTFTRPETRKQALEYLEFLLAQEERELHETPKRKPAPAGKG